ncbi:ComEC family competence protein [Pseudohoeflea suaedae]|uniref:ComEC family competence protein n=1 Tax=Pseudohoeflea suaedae TaxID=877384 RepID=A0A4R5PKF2_9HYPH|nr:ComEC/Rec2 family competence protein [Pseudohoeflea suaedae]TDH36190.1 ComEC family competence protein [Pseudohoeflea suaedae]
MDDGGNTQAAESGVADGVLIGAQREYPLLPVDQYSREMSRTARPAGGRSLARGLAGEEPLEVLWERERPHGVLLLLFAVSLALGAAIYQSLAREPPSIPLAIMFVILLAGALWSRNSGSSVFPCLLLLSALVGGIIAGRIETVNGPVLLDAPVTTTVTGTVLGREIDEGGRVRYLLAVLRTEDPELKRAPTSVRMTVSGSHQPYDTGSLVTGRGRLSPPSGPAWPGGYDFARAAYAQKIGAFGFFYRAPVVSAGNADAPAEETLLARLAGWVVGIRAGISQRVRSTVPGDPGALIAALTVSDRRGISEATVETLRATGLAHILAISGLHMALAAGTFFLGLRKLAALSPRLVERYPVKKAAALAAILIATSYLAISGAGVATQRAWLMMTVMFLAVIVDRPALTLRNVALAAIVILLVSPSAVVSPGFQMSFAATIALIATYGAWSRYRRGGDKRASLAARLLPGFAVTLMRGLAGLAVTSLVAGLATGLFAAWHFHRVAGFGLLANLLAMPLVSFVVMPAGLVAMLAMPLGLDHWPLVIMGKGLECVMDAARLVEGLGGNMTTGQIGFAALVSATAGFLLLSLLHTRLRLAGLVPLLAGVALTLPLFAPEPPDLVVSEDGRLVGIVGVAAIATNAGRPPEFIFEQWQRAWRRESHLQPLGSVAVPEDAHAALRALAGQATRTPNRFICSSRSRCVSSVAGRLVMALGEPADMGAGCDLADIVILAAAIRSPACLSGAKLFTARTLRETGALAIRFEDRARMEVETALGGRVRPWTVQRHYDWREDGFVLPDEAAARAITARGDMERGVLVTGEAAGAGVKKPADRLPAGEAISSPAEPSLSGSGE